LVVADTATKSGVDANNAGRIAILYVSETDEVLVILIDLTNVEVAAGIV